MTPLLVGDPAPWFRHRCTTPHGTYTFDMAAGRNVVLYFFPSSTDPRTAAALAAIGDARAAFDDREACFFGISADPADEGRLGPELPGIRFFLDDDRPVRTRSLKSRRLWYVLDHLLRARRAGGRGRRRQTGSRSVRDTWPRMLGTGRGRTGAGPARCLRARISANG